MDCRTGVLDGVRVDHPDGLRDPQQYFDRLRSRAPDAWIIGEKILEPGEFLRESWPMEGTSGYDFLNVCNNLMVYGDGLKELTTIYADFTAQPIDFESVAHDKKVSVQQEALGSDVNRLTSLFVEICEDNRDRRDYTRAEIRRALREVAACFAVYRTYVVPDRDEILDEDRALHRHSHSACQGAEAGFRFRSDRLYRRCACTACARWAGERICAALPAVHFSGDGQGRGRYCLLLL